MFTKGINFFKSEILKILVKKKKIQKLIDY